MTVASAPSPSPSPPRPEECAHPAPVTGVMAREFAHYDRARGPEGLRRTVTFYGPVIGGLPIQAWHCEECGLLRLSYPDGRREERRLYPGPQPGLLAEVRAVAVEHVSYGMQARVSGLSISRDIARELVAAPARRARRLPDWGVLEWGTALLLSAVAIGLLVAGYGAVAGTQTPSWEAPFVTVVAAVFVAWLLLLVAGAALRRTFFATTLAPSPAMASREPVDLDGATTTVVVALAAAAVLAIIIGILAAAGTSTPGIVGPLVITGVVVFAIGIVLPVVAAIVRRLTPPDEE